MDSAGFDKSRLNKQVESKHWLNYNELIDIVSIY